jgi:hypothetical protein
MADRLGGARRWQGCRICAALGQGDNDYAVHVWDGSCTEVLLARRTAVRGYCVVTWDLRVNVRGARLVRRSRGGRVAVALEGRIRVRGQD